MPSTIRVLDDLTINQMAAGEVIENPASVVKELIDNSLDADATEITIELKGGGRQLIRVTDNGTGMSHDDALLSLERHATSKLRSTEELGHIATMGFRGEAIPSIASISKFSLVTAPNSENDGTMVIVDGGRLVKHCSAARHRGTTVEVKSLFFNTPVRKKFQRSPNADAQQVQQMVGRLALARPDVTFHLIHNQKTLLKTVGKQGELLEVLQPRIRDVLGDDFFAALIPVHSETQAFTLTGYIGLPAYTRHNRTGQTLVVNKRPIWSHLLSSAIAEGYGTQLPSHRHPVAVLHLTLPPEQVDINVHPQKREVRLIRQTQFLQGISNGVQNALSQDRSTSQLPTPTPLPSPFPRPPLPSISEPDVDWILPEPTPPPQTMSPNRVQEELLTFQSLPEGRVVGTVRNYVLVELSDQVLFINQTAAERRLRYDHILEKLRTQTQRPESQALLVPITLSFPPAEASRLRELIPALEKLGLDITDFGQNNFAINSIPTFIPEKAVPPFVQELIDVGEGNTPEKQLQRTLSTLAVRYQNAPRALLSTHEAQQLYHSLLQSSDPNTCPLGQAIQTHRTLEEILEPGNTKREPLTSQAQ